MTPTHPLTTHHRPTTELRPHPHNPRNGDTDAIALSLQANGQYRPIVTTTDGTILAGNHTYAAAMELGWSEIACVTLDLDPYSAEARRIMLADNRTADLGTYDDGVLMELLASLKDESGGLLGTGYDLDDLTRLEASILDTANVPLDDALARMDDIDPLTCPNCGHTAPPADFGKKQ